jgi:hypothetical protein
MTYVNIDRRPCSRISDLETCQFATEFPCMNHSWACMFLPVAVATRMTLTLWQNGRGIARQHRDMHIRRMQVEALPASDSPPRCPAKHIRLHCFRINPGTDPILSLIV